MFTLRLFKTGKYILQNSTKSSLFSGFKPIFNFSSHVNSEPAFKNINDNNKDSSKPKLKVVNRNFEIQTSFLNKDQFDYLPQKDVPLCIFKESSVQHEPKKNLIHLTSDFSRYSSYKLNESCRIIRGRLLSNALDLLNYDQTKGGRLIKESLEGYMKNIEKRREKAKSRGEEVETNEYKIVEAYVGRKKGHKVINPRAKGRVDMVTRPNCKLFIKLEKVDNEKFFKDLALGKADFTFANSLRAFLFTNKASLRQIKSLSFITTARGRTYRKNQIKRLVSYLRLKYYKEKGIKLSVDVIHNYLTSNLGSALNFLNRRQEAISESERLTNYVADELVSYVKKDAEKDKKSLVNREALFNRKFSKS
jgi:ribosomal protein L22